MSGFGKADTRIRVNQFPFNTLEAE